MAVFLQMWRPTERSTSQLQGACSSYRVSVTGCGPVFFLFFLDLFLICMLPDNLFIKAAFSQT